MKSRYDQNMSYARRTVCGIQYGVHIRTLAREHRLCHSRSFGRKAVLNNSVYQISEFCKRCCAFSFVNSQNVPACRYVCTIGISLCAGIEKL